MKQQLVFAAACLATCLTAQSAEEREKYEMWTNQCDKFGYGWEPHVVETGDGWFLTAFRITEVKGEPIENDGRPPILIQHGAGQTGASWLGGFNPLAPTIVGQLAERGYDVWVGNNRGTIYSNENRNDDVWTLKEHWDFSWADYGAQDIPAFIDRIIETTGKPKVTMMGYSTGGAQMFYALATDQDYYATRVNRFVGLSPCQFMNINDTFENQVEYYAKHYELGVYNYWGGDDSSLNAENCKEISSAVCSNTLTDGAGGAFSTKSWMYFTQIGLAGRFQEPLSLEDWAAGKEPPLVDITKIDRVPVSIVQAVQDETCEPSMLEWNYAQVQSEEKFIRVEHGGHSLFSYETRSGYVDRMVETIETGTTVDSATRFTALSTTVIASLLLGQALF